MTERIKRYLYDIGTSVKSINEYLGEKRNFEYFKANKVIKRAIEREFEIIGEAVSRLAKIENAPKIENARRMVDLRNYIIHAYDDIDEEILWSIIIKYLPELEKEVDLLLKPKKD